MLEDVQGRQAGAGQERVLLVGVVADREVPGHVQVLPRDHGRQREDAAAERLPQDHDVGDGVEVLEREEASRLAEPVRYLVEDEERAVGVAGGPHLGPEPWRRHVGVRADRLGDDGGHVAFLLQHVPDEVGARQPAHVEQRPPVALGVAVGAPVARRRGDVLGAGQEWPVPARAVLLLPADARRAEAGAVIGVPERDRLEAAGGNPREPECDLDRVVAGRRQEDLAEGRGRPVREPPRQGDGHLVGEAAGREGEVVELGLEGRDQRRVRVAQVVDAVAVEVHEPAAVDLFDPDPLGPPDGGEPGCRRGLVEKVARVLVDQMTGVALRVRLSATHPAGIVSRGSTAPRRRGP